MNYKDTIEMAELCFGDLSSRTERACKNCIWCKQDEYNPIYICNVPLRTHKIDDYSTPCDFFSLNLELRAEDIDLLKRYYTRRLEEKITHVQLCNVADRQVAPRVR